MRHTIWLALLSSLLLGSLNLACDENGGDSTPDPTDFWAFVEFTDTTTGEERLVATNASFGGDSWEVDFGLTETVSISSCFVSPNQDFAVVELWMSAESRELLMLIELTEDGPGTITELSFGDDGERVVLDNEDAISPNGQYMAFLMNDTDRNDNYAYVVDLTSATPTAVQANPDQANSFGNVYNFTWSPDSQYILSRGDLDESGKAELWVAETADPTNTRDKISGTVVNSGDVNQAEFLPDSSGLLIRGDLVVENQTAVYYVPATEFGSTPTPTQVHADPTTAGDDVDSFDVLSDSDTVLLRGQLLGEDDERAYLCSLSNLGSQTDITGSVVAGGGVGAVYVLDNDAILIAGDLDTDGTFELYSVTISGGAFESRTSLIAAPTPFGGFLVDYHPNGHGIIVSNSNYLTEVTDIYYVSLEDGAGTPVLLFEGTDYSAFDDIYGFPLQGSAVGKDLEYYVIIDEFVVEGENDEYDEFAATAVELETGEPLDDTTLSGADGLIVYGLPEGRYAIAYVTDPLTFRVTSFGFIDTYAGTDSELIFDYTQLAEENETISNGYLTIDAQSWLQNFGGVG